MRGIVLLTLLGAAIAAPHISDRIMGGTDADIEKYPFMASLQFDWYSSTWQITCGGTIITTRTILSAAHCFVDYNDPPHWRARVGSSYPFIGGQVQTIQRFILHEAYDNLVNDVAIAVLNAPVTLSASVGTARIAGHSYHLAHDTQVTALGWGRLIWGGGFPDQLQEVDIYIVDQQLCWERYDYLRNIPAYSHFPEVDAGMICSGILNHWGADTCSGDSGGPVIHDSDVVIGITSWAYGCGDPWYPGVNVRITAYVNWIVANGSW